MKQKEIIRFGSLVTTLVLLQGCGGGNSQDVKETAIPTFITSATHTVQEGTTRLFAIETDLSGVRYAIVGGMDAIFFDLNTLTGELRFKTPQDYEKPADLDSDGTYEVVVQASKEKRSASQTFYITLRNDPSDDGDRVKPVFVTDTVFKVKENENFTAKINAIDHESNVSYYIDAGADAKRFRINQKSGLLSFYHLVPDFEIASDANRDNIFEVTIAAIDQASNKATQKISVQIQNDVIDNTYGSKQVFRTGIDDGGYGAMRNVVHNADETVTVLERTWEDTAHVHKNIGYYDALAYCANLELAGKTDWRLPTRRELYELVNYGNHPKIDDQFDNKNSGYFWTSQELYPYDGVPGDENNQTWTIQFGNGIDFASDKDRVNGYHVRCVRGYTIPNGRFTAVGNTIIDHTTNIVWENNTSAMDPTLTWRDAQARCHNLVLDGKDDWRLPNINELHTIIPNNDNEYQFTALTEQKTGPYWSSSAYSAMAIYYVENYWDAPNIRDVQNVALIHPDSIDSVRSRCIRGEK